MTDNPIIPPALLKEAIDTLEHRLSEITKFQTSLGTLLNVLERCSKIAPRTDPKNTDRHVHSRAHYWQDSLLERLDETSQLEQLNQQWAQHRTDEMLKRLRGQIQKAVAEACPACLPEHFEEKSASVESPEDTAPPHEAPPSRRKRKWPLEHHEYKRYSRQLIMPEIGLQGQLRLKAAKVLIIGAGGLGCPAAAYLAGAGVGTLGIADGDTVEVSNLHRQILHSMDTVGMLKTESAILRLKGMNPLVKYVALSEAVTPTNVLGMVEGYDLVLDCTDMPSTRYLISDACVIAGKPLVSASALRTSGQLTVFNYPPALAGAMNADGESQGGPCYRCVWPKPPPAEAVQGCGEGGILGPVVGVMGVLMATEALKMIASGGLETGSVDVSKHQQTMLMYSAMSPRPFQQMKLQPRRKGCLACSSESSVSAESLTSVSMDYATFCGLRQPINLLAPESRMTAKHFAAQLDKETVSGSQEVSLVDVRENVQYELAHMPGSVNIPWSQIERWKEFEDMDDLAKAALASKATFVCREGNDSQLAIIRLRELRKKHTSDQDEPDGCRDIIGGWRAWQCDVENGWPIF